MRYGLIAGNGKFPFLVLEGAKRAGASVAVAAIREETDPEIERVAIECQHAGAVAAHEPDGIRRAIIIMEDDPCVVAREHRTVRRETDGVSVF